MGNRELKSYIRQLLMQENFAAGIDVIRQLPGRQAVNPLFSFFHAREELVRWRAVTAMGIVVCRLADQDMESARVVMRRLMWNLNDESGGIGWGSPEAIGEITAGHCRLADEFSSILVSYIDPNGNYLEHELLQRGVLWGIGRLAHARPLHAGPAAPFLSAFFDSPDPSLRGTAIWAIGPILEDAAQPLLKARLKDSASLAVYRETHMTTATVAELAAEALSAGGSAS